MSFRRSKKDALASLAWRRFLQENAELLQASGVPISIYQSRELFAYFLMHGCIYPHADSTHFLVGQLSAPQRAALIETTARYLRAGFPDPGLGCGDLCREMRRRAGIPDPGDSPRQPS
jgi:hypothetical protein